MTQHERNGFVISSIAVCGSFYGSLCGSFLGRDLGSFLGSNYCARTSFGISILFSYSTEPFSSQLYTSGIIYRLYIMWFAP